MFRDRHAEQDAKVDRRSKIQLMAMGASVLALMPAGIYGAKEAVHGNQIDNLSTSAPYKLAVDKQNSLGTTVSAPAAEVAKPSLEGTGLPPEHTSVVQESPQLPPEHTAVVPQTAQEAQVLQNPSAPLPPEHTEVVAGN